MKRKISSHKGGRSERIYARIAPDVKSALLARIAREGFVSFADWLEAQAMPHLTRRGADLSKRGQNLPAKSNQSKGDLPG